MSSNNNAAGSPNPPGEKHSDPAATVFYYDEIRDCIAKYIDCIDCSEKRLTTFLREIKAIGGKADKRIKRLEYENQQLVDQVADNVVDEIISKI